MPEGMVPVQTEPLVGPHAGILIPVNPGEQEIIWPGGLFEDDLEPVPATSLTVVVMLALAMTAAGAVVIARRRRLVKV